MCVSYNTTTVIFDFSLRTPTSSKVPGAIIGIKYDFPCTNVARPQGRDFKIEGEARGFQNLSRDLAKVNAFKNIFIISP